MTGQRHVLLVAFVALASAAGTWLLGWWSVAVLAAVAGARGRAAWPAAAGATLGWVLLLVLDVAGGRFGAVADGTAAIMGLPAFALPVITLLFAAVLAWSAAVMGAAMARATGREDVRPH